MEPNANVNWSVGAWCFNPENPDVPEMKSLQVPSNERSVTMPGGKVHSGMPINADLAVHFIQNFFSHYQLTVIQPQANLAKFVAEKDVESLHKLYANSKAVHDSVVNLTYGMTLDKDLLLQVVSQPKCEGVRFYLCGREIPGDGMHLSLVCVGVDQDGYDLHYNLPETVKASATGVGNSIATQSLTLEYLTPPPPDAANKLLNPSATGAVISKEEAALIAELDERYTLLKMAKQPGILPGPTTPVTASAIEVKIPEDSIA